MRHNRLMSAGVAVLVLGLFAVPASAQQPASAPSILGEYSFEAADEQPVLISEAEGCRREITAATLTLQPENKWTLNATVRETCGENVTEKTARQEGTYTSADQALTFEVAQPAEQSAEEAAASIAIDPIRTASLGENDITVAWGDDRPTLIFRR